MNTPEGTHPEALQVQKQEDRPPAVLGRFLQPGFPFAKIFSVFFMKDTLVFAKTGSGATNAAGVMLASLGGYNATSMVASAIGSVADQHSEKNRSEKSVQLAAYSPEEIVASHKRNFMIAFSDVKTVEIKGPNWGGEVTVIITADKAHKFRIDKQSKDSAKYMESVFQEFLPGKVKRK